MPDIPGQKDRRPYITVTNEFPEHPKTLELSDAGFRTVVELWCYCNRNLTDGAVPEALLKRRYPPKVVRELVRLGFIDETPDGYVMHDYLDHQKSKAEVQDMRQQKQDSGRRGGKEGSHKRWHVDRGVFADDCELCISGVSGQMSTG